MRHKRYGDDSGIIHGDFFELPDEEYMQVEVDDEGGVVLWSSELWLDAALDQIREVVGGPSADDKGGLLFAGELTIQNVSSEVVETIARQNPASVTYYVANYGPPSVSWRSPQTKLRDGLLPRIECGIAAEQIDIDVLHRLMERTGSSRVRNSIESSAMSLVMALGRVARS